jgi:2-keto-4-pentenoate hydratase
MTGKVQEAANALWMARAQRLAIAPLRESLAPQDVEGAYAVQATNVRRSLAAGRRRVGRKIGLTSSAIQAQLGVDRPDFGVLLDDMLFEGPRAAIDVDRFLQPRIEGEIAFILAADILEKGLSDLALLARAGEAAAAFEIVDSAIADWKITLADTIADNASCGALVVGRQRLPLATLERRLAGMVLTRDGQVVSLGTGAATLGDPLAAFRWLADVAIDLGDPLRAGEVVITGALGPMVPFERGKTFKLEIAGFDPIFTEAR